jgi:hypothetical protein
MSKQSARKMCKGQDKNRGSQNPWEIAILDAQERLRNVEAEAAALRLAIKSFREMIEAGEPWPGTSESGERSVFPSKEQVRDVVGNEGLASH